MGTSDFNKIRSEMNECLCKARKELYQLISIYFENNPNANVKGKGRACHGVVTSLNDRADYYWISVMIEDKKYWLTMFYNEIDINSGNIHTQFGRIQFWRDVIGETPNGEAFLSGKKRWFLMPEKSGQPSNAPTYIGDVTYCPNEVVEQFISFIKKDIETKEAHK